MKSFASVMMGIAMIAVVVPVEYALAQTVSQQEHSYCDTTNPHTPETPATVFCDMNKGACNENTKTYHQPVQKCVDGGAEFSTACNHWMGPAEYVSYPIIAEGQAEYDEAISDLTEIGIVGCTLLGVVVTIKSNVFAGIVASIACGEVVYTVSLSLNLCSFGDCSVDWTREEIGPNRFHCD